MSSGVLSAVGLSSDFAVSKARTLLLVFSGTFNGTLNLEVWSAGLGVWVSDSTDMRFTATSAGKEVVKRLLAGDNAVTFRLNCLTLSAGSVSWSIV